MVRPYVQARQQSTYISRARAKIKYGGENADNSKKIKLTFTKI